MCALDTEPYENIARIASALSDESRLKILSILMENPATTSELVSRLGLDQPRASAHLAILRGNGLVSVTVVGRQHIYKLESGVVTAIFRALSKLARNASATRKPASKAAEREVTADSRLRRARTCYDHLAGVVGVQLLDEMLTKRWLEKKMVEYGGDSSTRKKRTLYDITEKGSKALEELGVGDSNLQPSRRLLSYGCLDWTERRYHLGGTLGKAILEQLLNEGIVERLDQERESRALKVCKPITQWMSP